MRSSRNALIQNRELSVSLLDQDNIVLTSPKRVRIGQVLAMLFAIGTGITGCEALGKVFSGLAFDIGAPILFFASTIANYKMLNKEVIAVLNIGFMSLFKHVNHFISPAKISLLSLGLLFSSVFGFAMGILTRAAIINLPAHFAFVAPIAKWLEIPGSFFAVISFTCSSLLMAKTLADNIKKQRLLHKIRRRFYNMFADRTPAEKILIGLAFTCLCTITSSLVLLGQTHTLEACADEQKNLLLKWKDDIAGIVDITNIIFTRVGGLLIQIPFTLQTLVRPLTTLFIKKRNQNTSVQDHEIQLPPHEKLNIFLLICSIFTAVGSGLIALSGKAINFINISGALGAFLNTMAGTFGNNLPAETLDEVDVEVATATPSSSARVFHRIGSPDVVPGEERVIVEVDEPIDRHADKPPVIVIENPASPSVTLATPSLRSV